MPKVYLIPIPIAEGQLNTLSEDIKKITTQVTCFFVENLRTARRFLKSVHPDIVIDDLQFSVIDKHDGPDINMLRTWLSEKRDIGIMSESGCPGVADPGAIITGKAHEMNAEVVPLSGPNSIIMALMASGLNGQSFAFNGYLPFKDPARSKKIKEFEERSAKEQQTQIFIETPYRNNVLFEELIKHCRKSTRLCVAYNISADDSIIKTMRVEEWKKNKMDIPKQPTVFLLQA